MAVMTIPGGRVTVDDDLLPILETFSWSFSHSGYAAGAVKGKRMFMHRFIMGAKGEDIVDHINGDKTDNRRENLRFATKSQNSQNAKRNSSSTGFIGVVNDKGRMKAGIKYNGKRRHIGMFDTALEAAIAYDKAALKLFGPLARTNIKHFEEILEALKNGQKT